MEYFCSEHHNGNHRDTAVKMIDFCVPKDQEERENVWIYKLRTLY